MMTVGRAVCLAIVLAAFPVRAAAEDFTESIHAFLQQRFDAASINAGIVVGIVDPRGSSIVSYGKRDADSDQQVSGDTVFEIGSVTKTFTGLLLQDMIQRGKMKLDDPVAAYLPSTVKLPTRNGKQITLLQLATHTSGLPREPDNLDPIRADHPCDGYTVEKLYAFLSGYQLTRDPGTAFEYSSAGIAVLAQAIVLTAGTDYESLVADRICQPLKMQSTRVTLTPEMRARFAIGHSPAGFAMPSYDCWALAPAGGVRSTAGDMLKYISAHLGLTPSSLTPLMQKTHEVRFQHVTSDTDIGSVWLSSRDPQGTEIVWHNGALDGSVSFAGFDKARNRGVVVLCNRAGVLDATAFGKFLLRCEWQSDRRPTHASLRTPTNGGYVGQYERSPVPPSGLLAIGPFLPSGSKPAACVLAGLFLAVLTILFRRARRLSSRLSILGCMVLTIGLLAMVLLSASSHAGAPHAPALSIRYEQDRLFAEATGSASWPLEALLPPIAAELLPESEARFFERVSGTPVAFSSDTHGKVIGLTLHHRGQAFSYDKISDEPLQPPERPAPPIIIKLNPKLLDAYVGDYEIPPDPTSPTITKLAIWREDDHLVGQFRGKNTLRGAIDIYPQSETHFVLNIDGSQLSFIKNGDGEVTEVIHHCPGVPDHTAKKMQN